MMQEFLNKRDEIEQTILKAEYLLEQFLPMAEHLILQLEETKRLEAENATLEAELEVLREEKRLVFPALIESVANVDNSLSAFLDDSIKRAAHRSDR